MKTFKKLFAVIIAFVMSLAIVVFAGCDKPDEGNTDNPGITTPEDQNKPNDDQNKPNGDQNNPDGDKVDHARVENILKEILTPVAAAQVTANNDYTYTLTGQRYYDNEAVNRQISYEGVLSGKLNFANGNADLSIIGHETDDGKETDSYSYNFIRNWNVFTYDSETEVTDFSDVTLGYEGPMIGNIEGAIQGAEYIPAVASMLPAVNYPIILLADATDSITFNGDTAKVDVNKLIYTELGWIQSALKEVNNDTKVIELLENENLRKVFEPLLGKVSATEINALLEMVDLETIPAEYKEIAEVVIDLFTEVQPEADSTTYAYLIKLVKSKELNDILGGLAENMLGISLPCDIGDLKLGFIIDLVSQIMQPEPPEDDVDITPSTQADEEEEAGFDISKVAAMVEAMFEGTTATKLVYNNAWMEETHTSGEVTTTNTTTFELSGAKITYTLSGNKIAGQVMEAEYTTTETEKTEAEGKQLTYTEVTAGSLNANLTFSDKAYELVDIDGNSAEYTKYTYNGVHEDCNIESYKGSSSSIKYELESLCYNIAVTLEDGEISAITNLYEDNNIYDKNECTISYSDETYYINGGLSEEGDYLYIYIYLTAEDWADDVNPLVVWYAPVKATDPDNVSNFDYFTFNLTDEAYYSKVTVNYCDEDIIDFTIESDDADEDTLIGSYEDGKLTVMYANTDGIEVKYEYHVRVLLEDSYYSDGTEPYVCLFELQEDADNFKEHYDANYSIYIYAIENTFTGTVSGFAGLDN